MVARFINRTLPLQILYVLLNEVRSLAYEYGGIRLMFIDRNRQGGFAPETRRNEHHQTVLACRLCQAERKGCRVARIASAI